MSWVQVEVISLFWVLYSGPQFYFSISFIFVQILEKDGVWEFKGIEKLLDKWKLINPVKFILGLF